MNAHERDLCDGSLDDSERGAFYNPAVEESYLRQRAWSDGLCDWYSSIDGACLACCCPCISIAKSLKRIGSINIPPVGRWDWKKYCIGFAAICLYNIFVSTVLPAAINPEIGPGCAKMAPYVGLSMAPPNASQKMVPPSFPATYGGAQPQPRMLDADAAHDSKANPLYGTDPAASYPAPPLPAAPAKSRHKGLCTTPFGSIASLLLWAFTFMILKGIKDKARVDEANWLVCLKSTCCHECCLCCQCCYIAQVARHIDRMKGFRNDVAEPGQTGSGSRPDYVTEFSRSEQAVPLQDQM